MATYVHSVKGTRVVNPVGQLASLLEADENWIKEKEVSENADHTDADRDRTTETAKPKRGRKPKVSDN